MKKAHLREIERINKSIPKELLDKLMKKEKQYETIKEIITRALQDAVLEEDIIKAKKIWYNPITWFSKDEVKKVWKVDGKIFHKEKYEALLRSGELDKEIEIVDEEVEKQIDSFLEIEFDKARKLGRLPAPQKWDKFIKKSKKIYVESSKENKE